MKWAYYAKSPLDFLKTWQDCLWDVLNEVQIVNIGWAYGGLVENGVQSYVPKARLAAGRCLWWVVVTGAFGSTMLVRFLKA